MLTPVLRRPAPAALPFLLAQYLSGRIEQARWDALSDVLDAPEADHAERTAFAAFCLDAAALGECVSVPAPAEAQDLLAATRA